MPRPQRCRKIRSYPEQWSFLPEDGETGQTPVILTLDEFVNLCNTKKLIGMESFLERKGISYSSCTI